MAVTDTTEAFGHLDIAVHDVADLRQAFPDWDSFPRTERAQMVRQVAPVHTQTATNVQLDGWHRHLVDLFDPGQDTTRREIREFAVGDDGTVTDPSDTVDPGDTALGNQVYQTTTAQDIDEGRDLFVSGFLDSSEANGETLREFAVIATHPNATDVYVNRALFDPEIDKSSSNTVTVDVTLGWRSA